MQRRWQQSAAVLDQFKGCCEKKHTEGLVAQRLLPCGVHKLRDPNEDAISTSSSDSRQAEA